MPRKFISQSRSTISTSAAITDQMAGACGDRLKTIKTIFVAEKFNFFGKKVFSGERFRIMGVILHELHYGSKPHVEGELFPLKTILTQSH